MKHSKFTLTAVFVAAVLFSCGGNQSPENVPAGHEGHDHDHTPTTDTVVISEGQSVFFSELKDGAEVKSPLVIKFGVKGMETQSIDSGIRAQKGHHHLLIDTMEFIPAGHSVPAIDNRIIHYGKGQTESKPITLSPGKHRIAIQFADGIHRSYGQRMSKAITIVVK